LAQLAASFYMGRFPPGLILEQESLIIKARAFLASPLLAWGRILPAIAAHI
jgi:hypothetical protein